MQQQLAALTNSPYGSSATLLRSSIQDLKDDIFKPVSPIAQRPYITEATSPQKTSASPLAGSMGSSSGMCSGNGYSGMGGGDFKGGLSQPMRVTPKPLSQISLNKKQDLFEGLEDEETPCFLPRKNIKKLLFKPQSAESNTSRRSSANSSVNGDAKVEFMRSNKPFYQDESINYNLPSTRPGATNNSNHNNTTFGAYTFGQITNDLTNVSEDGASENGGGGGGGGSGGGGQALPAHPANIVLERPGYFTIPSMSDLAVMTDSKGDCFVENFAIGRVDYGCVTFPGVTNLADLNLDEIVHIRRKEVHVYPDDTRKPPAGEGLNRPAEITLHRIWPTHKQTKMPIQDANVIVNMGYDKKIERATSEMGAQFVDYDPVTGSWTFKVKHFSKYGLMDSDEDEDEANLHQQQQQHNHHPNNQQLQQLPIKAFHARCDTENY
jgi:nuclear pore complex protein Nup98-Nup96